MIESIDLLLLKIFYSPGEARTHNPGIALQCTVYKYRALTDCATGANQDGWQNIAMVF